MYISRSRSIVFDPINGRDWNCHRGVGVSINTRMVVVPLFRSGSDQHRILSIVHLERDRGILERETDVEDRPSTLFDRGGGPPW